jgi:hypothetical protein
MGYRPSDRSKECLSVRDWIADRKRLLETEHYAPGTEARAGLEKAIAIQEAKLKGRKINGQFAGVK